MVRIFLPHLCVLILSLGCSYAALGQTEGTPMPSDKEYVNPLDQKVYSPEGGWRTCEPESPQPKIPGRKVKIGHVRLLMPEQDIAAQTTVMELATFTKEAERLAEETFSKSDQRSTLLVQFDCTPSGHEIRLGYQGDVSQELLRQYYDALKAAQKLRVKNDKVLFQLELLVNQ